MLRLHWVAICSVGLAGGCNARRASDHSAIETTLRTLPAGDPLAALGGSPATPEGGASASLEGTLEHAAASATDTEVDPASAKTFLVWTRDGRGHGLTYHLDKSGEELERLDGVHVGTRAGTWQWREEEVSLPTKPCEHASETGDVVAAEPLAPGRATRVKLVATAGATREQRIVDPSSGRNAPDDEAEPSAGRHSPASASDDTTNEEDGDLFQTAEDLRHTVTLSGSIGPYLFFEESTYAYTCGAHGNTFVSSRIWNAASAQPQAMPVDIGPLDGPVARAARELSDDDDPFPVSNDNLEVTALVPHYVGEGLLRLGVQFTAPTCYACTRGGFSSYTKSTVVDAASLPKTFARYAKAPEPVRAWAASHPDEQVGGWSGLAW
jgi:hypothetical protein